MVIIGITGGIGSGKSTVSEYLSEKGYDIIDADKIAREILMPGQITLNKLVEIFGGDILNKRGELRRKYLASIVFADEEKKRILDEITHREIEKNILLKIETFKAKGARLLFLDIPLLFETGMESLVDYTWLVTSPKSERVKRVTQRDGMALKDVINRMDNQMTDEEKIALADNTVDNSGSKEELYQEIDRLLLKYE